VAKQPMLPREYTPEMLAPVGGAYEQCNVLGSLTGMRVTVARGEKLPPAPRGFTWRVVEPPPERNAAD
jgi:hypothetical protein